MKTSWRLRRPRGPLEVASAAVVGLAVVVMVVRMITALADALAGAWPTLLMLTALAGAAAAWRARPRVRGRRRSSSGPTACHITLSDFDAIDDRGFEWTPRDLLVRDGWVARGVGGGGDQAADVIADHPVLGRIVVQAKRARWRESHVHGDVHGERNGRPCAWGGPRGGHHQRLAHP